MRSHSPFNRAPCEMAKLRNCDQRSSTSLDTLQVRGPKKAVDTPNGLNIGFPPAPRAIELFWPLRLSRPRPEPRVGRLRRFMHWREHEDGSPQTPQQSDRPTREKPARGQAVPVLDKACSELRESVTSSWCCKTGCQYVTV